MANIGHGKKYETNKSKILYCATKLFLEKGYTKTTMKEIATESGVNIGSLFFMFKDKESLLSELVNHVLNCQYLISKKLLEGNDYDLFLLFVVEKVLQLYIAESKEHMREMYTTTYSLTESTNVVYQRVTQKLEVVFKDYLPNFETKDFYEREIALGGIIRGFMSVPCDMYFTMERKIKSFLETTLLVFEVPKDKIKDTINFVNQLDFTKAVEDTIKSILLSFELSK